jgi:parvulin-like peptidyl-prolyl isomerase
MSKGSRRRPTKVPTEVVDNNYEAIFGKYVPLYMRKQILDEPKPEVKDDLEEYKKQAQETWNDSCTSPRKGTQ